MIVADATVQVAHLFQVKTQAERADVVCQRDGPTWSCRFGDGVCSWTWAVLAPIEWLVPPVRGASGLWCRREWQVTLMLVACLLGRVF